MPGTAQTGQRFADFAYPWPIEPGRAEPGLI